MVASRNKANKQKILLTVSCHLASRFSSQANCDKNKGVHRAVCVVSTRPAAGFKCSGACVDNRQVTSSVERAARLANQVSRELNSPAADVELDFCRQIFVITHKKRHRHIHKLFCTQPRSVLWVCVHLMCVQCARDQQSMQFANASKLAFVFPFSSLPDGLLVGRLARWSVLLSAGCLLACLASAWRPVALRVT